ncbi:hypothetical protein SCUCBS95973_002242 [Sporothrix curviconia]|uniref:Uncharacterized protein n=1 Tax=Sporothrix curviconia TaxID=1260050 RepID=A0ABP0B5F9_9PEZI
MKLLGTYTLVCAAAGVVTASAGKRPAIPSSSVSSVAPAASLQPCGINIISNADQTFPDASGKFQFTTTGYGRATPQTCSVGPPNGCVEFSGLDIGTTTFTFAFVYTATTETSGAYRFSFFYSVGSLKLPVCTVTSHSGTVLQTLDLAEKGDGNWSTITYLDFTAADEQSVVSCTVDSAAATDNFWFGGFGLEKVCGVSP